ncbi:MAG: DUF6029 family protein [Bacteroidales bacterium]
MHHNLNLWASLLLLILCFPFISASQGFLTGGQVTGNVHVDAQIYSEDEKLGITDSTLNFKKFGMNGFANVLYSNNNFNAGMRFEGFLNPMTGYDARYEGIGVPYWFAGYKLGILEMTAGHFYEQFGSGLILRSWEEWTLGYDNNIYGFHAKITPVKGISIKGLTGVQRYFWEPYKTDNRGIVRGTDGEIFLNDVFESLSASKTKLTFGGSFVSRYEKAENKTFARDSAWMEVTPAGDTINWITQTTYQYRLPVNVGSWAARMNLARGGFNFYAEYAQKGSDPNATNNFIYKNGQAIYSTLSYSTKGFGFILGAKWIDNMSYKSSRNETGSPPMLDINYLPAMSKEHPYSLSTFYPYATKANGEAGFQGQIIYTIPKNTKLGGKYGTNITANYSLVNSIKKEQLSPEIPLDSIGTDGYKATFLSIGDIPYYRDLNFLLERRIGKKIRVKAAYYNQTYNLHVIEDDIFDDEKMVYARIGVIDFSYKFNSKHAIRAELQGLWTKEDEGNWVGGGLEYTVSPHWFFSVTDEWNYGHPQEDKQLHYYGFAMGYNETTNRIAISYARQREGLICIGGVCRYVPSFTGFTLSITSSF